MFTLNEALACLSEKPEFSVNQREFGTVIDYNVTFPETFVGKNERETLILQNLRGTCFNHDGEIIRLAYHKFHNLNENSEYRAENFNFSEPHVVQEKLDGSMVTPLWFGKGFRLATRAGVTDVSNKAEMLLIQMRSNQPEKYEQYETLFRMCRDKNITPIFEFCSREQRIVIDYEEAKLVFTGARSNDTGEYVTPVLTPLIDVVKVVSTEHSSISQLASAVRDWVGTEGVVVKFSSGKMVKIKGEDYCLKHKALDGLRFEKDVLAIILENKLDDVVSFVDDAMRSRLEKYQTSVMLNIAYHQAAMLAEFERVRDSTQNRAEFAAAVKASIYKTGLFQLLNGKNYDLLKFALTKTTSQTNVESVRWLIGPSFYNF